MWFYTATRKAKVNYVTKEHLEKNYNNVVRQNQQLLTKVDSLIKLIEQILNILLSYNPKLVEQTKEQLDKINEEGTSAGVEPQGDTSG